MFSPVQGISKARSGAVSGTSCRPPRTVVNTKRPGTSNSMA